MRELLNIADALSAPSDKAGWPVRVETQGLSYLGFCSGVGSPKWFAKREPIHAELRLRQAFPHRNFLNTRRRDETEVDTRIKPAGVSSTQVCHDCHKWDAFPNAFTQQPKWGLLTQGVDGAHKVRL